jgi:NitT/TauT family transport system substrate-binding protein
MKDGRNDWSRRELLERMMATATAGWLGLLPEHVAAQPSRSVPQPPEIRSVRFTTYPAACIAPLWVAEDLLRGEGFTEVSYVDVPDDQLTIQAMAAGRADFSIEAAPAIPFYVDAGLPVIALTGLHTGCFELFGNAGANSVRDLRGKRVCVTAANDERHLFVAIMLTHVGVDPRRDVRWDFRPSTEGMKLFAAGKVDAFLGFPPDPQELRARKIGHVIVNTSTDRPWSNYFCCMLTANRAFVQRYPVATKCVVRSLLKAAAVCAREPELVVRMLAAKGYERRSEYALEVLKQLPYGRWREFSPDDTLRFYALRLHEAGLTKSGPQKILAQGADWRFLTELRKELRD